MSNARQAMLPGYLLLCLLIGGSAQGMWGNAILQLGGIALLAWAMLTREPQPMTRAGRALLLVAGLLALLFVIQLVPLPAGLWAELPGRAFVAQGFALLGMQLPPMPTSLAPYDTMTTALKLLPPLALLVGMLRLRSWNASWMLASIVIGAAISIALGVLQVRSGTESWYFYQRTNVGIAVGIFANGNHFATLLLLSLPILAALAADRWRSQSKAPQRAFTGALAAAAAAVLAIGFLINGSAAILLLGLPVAAASLLLALRPSPRQLRIGTAAIALLLALGAAAIVTMSKDLPNWGTAASIETRSEYWSKSVRIAEDHALTGSGFGTFQQVYRGYEDPAAINRWYANHAHNDYLEVALEGGAAAILLLLAFLAWWVARAREAWFSPGSSLEQKAAVVASAAVLLHSAFDFPLRTAAIAGVMAVFLALLAGARGVARPNSSEEVQPLRHATL